MKGDLTKAILAEVEAFPGRTAYEIATSIRDAFEYAHDPSLRQVAATVSGILARLAKQGRVTRGVRRSPPGEHQNPWVYFPVAK